MRELFRNDYLIIRHDARNALVVVTRFAPHWKSIEVLNETFDHTETATLAIQRHKTVLLIDSREAPTRNDPQFESAFEVRRRLFTHGYKKIAALVKTAVGKLQIRRHFQEDHLMVEVFADVNQALTYLEVPTTLPIDLPATWS